MGHIKKRRPRHTPTDETRAQVARMSGIGLSHEQISVVLNLAKTTVQRHYKSELQRGKTDATRRVCETLFNAATDPDKPNITACIFWLKAQAGWTDKPAVETLGKKGIAEKQANEARNGRFSASSSPTLVISNQHLDHQDGN